MTASFMSGSSLDFSIRQPLQVDANRGKVVLEEG